MLPQKLRPITRILATIGELPTSYLISMTYEEQLLWLCNYLEKTVIPAINNNADALAEVQKGLEELKQYVDDYFDNLDIQEEIDKKLEEMIESGELIEIITQYLELSSILGFDTISDLQNADNLLEGTICKTLGQIEYNDGYGHFYRIRTKLESDVIDGINIIELTNYPDFIAEKIKNYNYQEIEDFVLYAFFDPNNSNEISLYVSKDNLNLEKLNTTPLYGRDPSIAYFNQKFYIAVTDYTPTYDFKIYESSDLMTWTTHQINLNLYNENYPKRWAPEFFIDNDDIYIFISVQYADDTHPSSYGKFKIYKTQCINTDELYFDTPIPINMLNTSNDNYIDASCIKIGSTYHLIVKNETQTKLTLDHFTSNDLQYFTLDKEDFAQFGRYVEGPFVYKFKNEYIIGCDKYNDRNSINNIQKIKTSTDFQNFSNYKLMYIKNKNLSHGSGFVIDSIEAKNVVSKISNYGFKYNHNFEINNKNNFMIAGATTNHDYDKGRYLKIMSIKPRANYKSSSIIIHLFDTQRVAIDSVLQLQEKTYTINPFAPSKILITQLEGNPLFNSNYKGNLHGKVIGFANSETKTYDVYLDTNGFEDLTIMCNIMSTNVFDADIEMYCDVFANTLPIDLRGISNQYKCKNYCSAFNNLYIDNRTNTKLTLKMCAANGSFKLEGHGNGTSLNKTYNYTINTWNGSIEVFNNTNTTLSYPLTFTVTNYTEGLYTIEITGIEPYSGFNITLPVNAYSTILDYTLSN